MLSELAVSMVKEMARKECKGRRGAYQMAHSQKKPLF
jgi:hypothetical protein